MKSVMVRLEDGVYERLKELAGKRGMGGFLKGLVLERLGGASTVEDATHDTPPAVVATRIRGLVTASELPAEIIPEHACCGAQVRSGICGAKATFSRGDRFFCPEH